MLAFITTLEHPEMVGVNPEVAHEHMAGLNSTHHVAQAWSMGKLFHIDLNDQIPGRYDQDLRFGSANPKAAFFLVKFLEDVGYAGSRHFDAHAYRTSDYEDVKAFARGCMRTYLILKDKAERWNADPEIQALVAADRRGRRVDGALPRPVLRRTAPRRSAASSSTGGRSPRAASPTSGSISSRSTCCSGLGDARGIPGSSAAEVRERERVLGLDVSTTATKAVLVDGRAPSARRRPWSTPSRRRTRCWSEQDPNVWWDVGRRGRPDRAAARLGGDEVEAVGLTGQMHGLVALDAEDRVLRPAILWNDQRTEAECDEIRDAIGRERLIGVTGNDALPGFTAPKLLWVRRHEPEVWSAIAHVLLPKDFVRLRLTGDHAVDRADGAGTLLFDLARRDWSDEVVAALGIDPSWLPPTYEGPEVTGSVTRRGRRGDRPPRRDARGRRGRRSVRGGGRRRRGRTRGRLALARELGRGLRHHRRPASSNPRAASTRSATPCRIAGT